MIRVLLVLLLAVALRGAGVDYLLAADEAELRPLLAKLADARPVTRAAWTAWTGTLGGHAVALVRTEGDPLNAVAAVTLAIRRHEPRVVLTFGAARAHAPDLRPGDVVAAVKFAAFDGIVSPSAGLGEGSDALRWRKLRHPVMTAGEKETAMDFFPADAVVAAKLRALVAPRGRVIGGVLGSAHQVNGEADRRAWLHHTWDTSCEDGESAHVAGTALLLGVPAAGLRVIDGQPGEAAALVLQFLEVRP